MGKGANAFEGVTFGTAREDATQTLMKNLNIIAVQGFSGVDLRGPSGLRVVEEDDVLVLQRYRLNGRRMDVALFFNVNGRFYRYQYEAQRRPSSYFETAIKDDVLFISQFFQKERGSPSFKMNPKLVEMRPGARGYFWRWTKGRDTVYTAIAAGDHDFGAIGVVSDDNLQREAPELRPVENVPDLAVEEPILPPVSQPESATFESVVPMPEAQAAPVPEPLPESIPADTSPDLGATDPIAPPKTPAP